MPIADAATGISETADAVELLMTHMGSFVIGVRSGLSGSGGDILDVDLAPAASMSQAVTVEVPELSIGFQGSETPLLIALADEDSAGGPVPAGMTMGSGTATVMRAPNAPFGWSGEGQVMAYAELGGADPVRDTPSPLARSSMGSRSPRPGWISP